jgi:NAD(P)H-dependent flavin oxidoreductase YrpB (nitropropane dioxygenase family)
LILEGPLAGGHLGFSEEQLQQPEKFSLEILLPEILETIKPYEDRYGKKIPVITAGGIFTGADMARMLRLGASGVQIATRFVCTEECGVSSEFKQHLPHGLQGRISPVLYRTGPREFLQRGYGPRAHLLRAECLPYRQDRHRKRTHL